MQSSKTFRILMACTVLLPVWAFMWAAAMLFPVPLMIGLGAGDVVAQTIKLWFAKLDHHEVRAARENRKESFGFFLCGVFFPFYVAYQYVQTGKFLD